MTGNSLNPFRPAHHGLHATAVFLTLIATMALGGVTTPAAAGEVETTGTEQQSSAPISPDVRFETVVEQFIDAKSPAHARSLLYRIRELENLIPVGRYRDLLEKAKEQAAYPTAKFAVERLLHDDRLNRGFSLSPDAQVSEQLKTWQTDMLRGGNCLADWRVVGPFDNDSMDGFNARLGPERGESGPYQGKNRTIDWRAFPRYARGCHLYVGKAMRPASSSVAYLARTLEVESEGTRRLLIGADGAYRVWVNGELVAERSKDLGFAVDAQAWKLPLEAGSNRILVKLGSTRTGSMSLMARVVGPDLEPTESPADTAGFTSEVGKLELKSVDNSGDPSSTEQGLADRIQACATDSSLSPERRIDCLVTWSSIESQNSAEPWEDIADNLVAPLRRQPGRPRGPFGADAGNLANKSGDADVGVKSSGDTEPPMPTLDARAIARLADVYDSQDDRVDVLRVAHHRAPEDPVVELQLADAELGSLEDTAEHRRKRRLERIQRNHPEMWQATLEMAHWYSAHGFGRRALKMASNLQTSDKMKRPEILSSLSMLHDRHGEKRRARELSRRLAEMSRVKTGWVRRQIDEAFATGDRETALKWINQQVRFFPWSVSLQIRRANAFRMTRGVDAAITDTEEMLNEIPGSVRLHRYKAELLAASGHPEEAVQTLKTALEFDPQNQRLRDYLSYLQPSEKSFHEPWMIEDVRAEADDQPTSDHSVDTIIDQTVVRVSPNGLSQRVVQVVQRVNNVEGIDTARSESVSFRRGDEYVDVLSVKVHKQDGRVLEEYSAWTSGGSRKGSSYYNDLVYRNIRAKNVENGDLVEIRYRLKQSRRGNFRGDYFGDLSYVQQTRPVGFARYVVEAPETWELHFNAPESEHTEVSERPGDNSAPEGFRVHGFELRDIPAVKTDADMPGYTDVYDYLMVSNKETWDEIGDWWWGLIEEQLITSDPIKKKVSELTEGLDSDRAKMEAIHNWVVKNTRYLHVGLGVHGWKPYKTTRAFKNKFGDCKDKSSLLKVMLEEAGIRTHLVLVRTRDLGHVETRPASMHIFNHAINYVPKFDLYLDATAEFNGTTELTPMDQGAQGLVVQDGGAAEFTRLPIDDPEDNKLTRRFTVHLPATPDGEADVKGEYIARGQNAVYYRQSLQDPDRRDEIFEKQLADTYSGATLDSADYRHLTDLERTPRIEFAFTGGRFLRGAKDSMFVYPYGAERDLLSIYAKQSERHQDLTIRVPFVNETEVIYVLPQGKDVENVPDSVRMNSDFGELRIDYQRRAGKNANRLTVDIRYSLKKQRVPVERYDEFRSFLSKMTSALNQTLTISSG